ncbi:hypothetical protein CKM354_001126300 [Cercospora kikuchii]|uniref:NACHT domain-containing protein n=1 Tax=Cercospora kikuchii TaxID=84275 RepID=A0A9P3CRY6_9PEZI|nr:uncharacterized protein CKM354_001126300 [Cercospora kikuchii]GIZ48192.1 hypothetical protein CKM354_001126300 [Cercospora kikuchii]
MRLLCVDTLKLRQFDEPNKPPPYAIASHRWCDSEVTLEDVESRRNTKSAGYKKVRGFAEYVKDNVPSIKWLWIDTCCIDKRNAVELSFSINSMFRWYRDAELCLAYLGDVKTVDNHESFRQSMWFTRGWTLQELLAPRTVVFLTKHWKVIGNKGASAVRYRWTTTGPSLEGRISQIAGIPEDILRSYEAASRLDISEKRRWMDGRITTREEDIYYAMLGILDLGLVVNYGEGRARAEQRLLAAIDAQKVDLSRLTVVRNAVFNSSVEETTSFCLEGTRSEILRNIQQWVDGSDEKSIFWLCGKAGTGKSTISRTIAQRLNQSQSLSEQPCLGASFFFKRGEQDRSNANLFFATIAAQFADLIPAMRRPILAALDKDSFMCSRGLQEQFEKLLLQPVLSLNPASLPRQRFVIVIDALDECDRSTDIRLFLRLLAQLDGESNLRLRIFLTSRPELPVQLGFRALDGSLHQDIVLEEVQADTIHRDIRAYFDAAFVKIREDRIDAVELQHWPSEANLQALVELAVPLFIFASTVCRFVSETKPRKRLELILAQRHAAVTSHLAKTYLPILSRLLGGKPQREREELIQDFRKIVGPIVLAADPLSVSSLASLLCDESQDVEEEDIRELLRHLHSVLEVPSNPHDPVRLLHLSFRDFLVDAEREDQEGFWIDEVETHAKLSQYCLRRLNEDGVLRLDMCRVVQPGTRRFELSPQQIQTHIPPDVAYACSYWPLHIMKGRSRLRDNGGVHRFLRRHLLHWLEALSWLGRISSAIGHISALLSIVDSDSHDVTNFLQDAKRFVLRNRYVIDLAPLQLYHSALVFTPTQSLVRRTFSHEIRQEWARFPEVPVNWSAEVQKLEGHDDRVTAIVFSPDGQVIASASWDQTVRVWNAATGEQTQKLKGHGNTVSAVAFSPDGQVIASASNDNTVRVWNAATGEQTQKLKGHDHYVTAVAFSPDGQVIASATYDQTVRVWNAATGQMIHVIPDVRVTSRFFLVFSEDGNCLRTSAGEFHIPHRGLVMPSGTYARTSFLELRDQWICNQGADILWLPHEYRGSCSAVYEKALVIGQTSGAVSIFRLE